MNKQQGSAHVVIVVILVLALLGALGFIFWQNFLQQDEATATTKQTNSETVEAPVDNDQLQIKELGLNLETEEAKYKDISYYMTSVNKDDANKYIAAIFSKDLNDRLVADAKKVDPSSDFDDLYVRYSANRAVYAYYYEDNSDSTMPNMMGGVAANIVNPSQKTASSKLYVGFMGPGSYSTTELSDEMETFRDFVKANLK